jgi:hypothetical protein
MFGAAWTCRIRTLKPSFHRTSAFVDRTAAVAAEAPSLARCARR